MQLKRKIVINAFAVCLAFASLLLFASRAQAQCTPTLALNPAGGIYTTGIGATFDVNIEVDTCSYDVDAVDAVINYDPAILEVDSISEGSIFSTYPLNQASGGTISLSGIDLSTPFNGTGVLGTIHFRAIDTGSTGVDFVAAAGGTTDSNIVEHGTGTDVLGAVLNGNYSITSGSGGDDDGGDFEGDTLPDTGIFDNTILIAALGLLMISIGVYLYRTNYIDRIFQYFYTLRYALSYPDSFKKDCLEKSILKNIDRPRADKSNTADVD